MGNQVNNVLADDASLTNASKGYDKLSQNLAGDKKTLEEKNTNLKEAWLGTSGDQFYYAYYTIEKKMANLITRCANASSALDETNVLFKYTDTDAKKNIKINQQGNGPVPQDR